MLSFLLGVCYGILWHEGIHRIYLKMEKEYKEFQKKIYACLVDYKEKHITRDCGRI